MRTDDETIFFVLKAEQSSHMSLLCPYNTQISELGFIALR